MLGDFFHYLTLSPKCPELLEGGSFFSILGMYQSDLRKTEGISPTEPVCMPMCWKPATITNTQKWLWVFLYQGSHKNDLLTVRLTVRVAPPPLMVSFLWFLGVRLTSDYEYMCSETNFTQEKVLSVQILESSIHP